MFSITDLPKYLYHATPACNLNSIKKYGLGAKFSNRLWDYGDTEYADIPNGVFLATDEYVTESYVEGSENFDELADAYESRYGKELEIAVLAVKTSDLDISKLEDDSNEATNQDEEKLTYFYRGIIPASKLKRIRI